VVGNLLIEERMKISSWLCLRETYAGIKLSSESLDGVIGLRLGTEEELTGDSTPEKLNLSLVIVVERRKALHVSEGLWRRH
jgi:hypothetical protein